MAKQLCFDSEARDALKQGILKLARAVKSTLGPRGRCAVIDRGWGGPTITKDGYTVADEIELRNKFENMGAQLLKEAANKTHDVAGDGTTTATVLAEAIYKQALRHITAGANVVALNRGMRSAVNFVIKRLEKDAMPVKLADSARVTQIATIAANDDRDVGNILVDAYKKVGKDGVVNIEEGKGTSTDLKVVEGMQFDRGFLSPHFVTDAKSQECEYHDVLVLIHEDKITSVKKLVPLLEAASKANKPLLIIAEDVEGEALATLVVNNLRGVVNCVAVKAPGYGERRKAMLQDIAILTGVKRPVFKDTGVELESLTIADLGRARKITITADTTTLVEGAGKASDLSARIKQIRSEIETTDSNYDKEKLQERLAKLAGGVALISVGAATETEMKEKKARIKDAESSIQAALEKGILPGGGVALLRIAEDLGKKIDSGAWEDDERIGATVLREALPAPFEQIIENAGGYGPVIAQKVLSHKGQKNGNIGYDVLTSEVCDLVENGVIDPCKVTTAALTNAVSVASILISTNCLVADAPEQNDDDDHAHDDMDY